MAPPLQRIHPRLPTAALSFVRKPAGALGVWTQAPAMFSGSSARYAGPDAGTAQQEVAPPFSSIPNGASHRCMTVQLLTDPLRDQVVATGSWTVRFAAKLANAGATLKWTGLAALHVVNGQTGGRRGTIFNTSAIGTTARTVATERTCLASVTGSKVQIRAGDYLSLELGMLVANTAGAVAPQITVYADGATAISTDDVAATTATSVLEAPVGLLLALPLAGEQPDPSLTHGQTVALLKEMWPPHSDILYDWETSDEPLKQIIDWLADAMKLYGYDQVDRLFRESLPLTCVEQIPAWEALLGIAQGRVAQRGTTVGQRRDLILSRLREFGPLTLYSLASIFGRLAAYAPNTRPDVYEMDTAEYESLNEYIDLVPTADGAIPEGTDFASGNLHRDLACVLDGGHVGEGGVIVYIALDDAKSQFLHFRLYGPDFTAATWGGTDYPLPDLESTIWVRSVAHKGAAVAGKWRLYAWRDVGSPAVTIESWGLIVFGDGHGGAQHISWSVHLDSAHQAVDRRDVESTLDRISQSYARGFCVYATDGTPGTATHRPGWFLPGS